MEEPKKKGPGRPFQDPESNRTERVIINLTQEEKKFFAKFVRTNSISLAQFFRDAGRHYIEALEERDRKTVRKPRGSIE